MYATTIIVFREVLEAALIVSIIMAAARGLAGRGTWVSLGIGGGLAGSCVVAAFAEAITAASAGLGQELLNAGILFLAAIMLAWHSIWMARHAREFAHEVSATGKAVAAGEKPLYAIAIVVASAVLREGSETVLFLMGAGAGQDGNLVGYVVGGLIGALLAIATGVGLYAGLLRIPLKRLFSVTNIMILLLMAGMVAQGAGYLVQAGFLPALASPLWDTSMVLTEKSIPGKVLHALMGYQARPAGVQVLIYVWVLLGVVVLSHLLQPAPQTGGPDRPRLPP
jgi:high-affinity iron transporter